MSPRWARLRVSCAWPALIVTLGLAWVNFLTTSRWADQPGALHGWRWPWYATALSAATLLAWTTRRQVGRPAILGRAMPWALVAIGGSVLGWSLVSRLPPTLWGQIPFKDDWTELYQQAVNGIALMQRGAVVGWNWWFLGGYPTSTDIAQNFSLLAFVPMTVFGAEVGYHVLHVLLFLAVPAFVWWDLSHDDRRTAVVATGLAAFFAAGYFGAIGSSGDTNSLVGVFCVGLAFTGSRAARLGRRWGGPLLLVALTLAAHSHTAFFVYAFIYLFFEAVYFKERAALIRLAVAATVAGVAALPVHWESLRYREFVSFNNTVYDPASPRNWNLVLRTILYNIEILALPHRWFNDYRSLANIWLPVLVATGLAAGRSRIGFYAWAAVVTQGLLRLNTAEAGALFDRIQHMFPLLLAPALAGFVLRFAGSRVLAISLTCVLALYVQTPTAPIRHVSSLRSFNPPLIDRVAAADGGLVLVEVSPHRDMDRHPTRRSPTTPFDVHFEGLLPSVAGQRFYSQMIDGWVWNVFRGQVVGAGTYLGRPIAETPTTVFIDEMHRWGVRHLFVWTDETRDYLRSCVQFAEQWSDGRWSHFELARADVRSVVTRTGTGRLTNLDFLGADVVLTGVRAGTEVVIRANYYPAWRAYLGEQPVAVYASAGRQLAFRAPLDGAYTVRLAYPRYGALIATAVASFLVGAVGLWLWRPARRSETARPCRDDSGRSDYN